MTALNQNAFNAAENGLLVRIKPEASSSILGKLEFGEKVQIIERTNQKLTVIDNENKIEARWYKITSLRDRSLKGYVFSGYLTNAPISKKRQIQLNGYKLTLSESSKHAFKSKIKETSGSVLLDQNKCIRRGILNPISNKEMEIKLSNNTFMTLKKRDQDDQFFGYTFIHYDSVQELFFFWENWLEAGHPIMIERSTGKTTEVVGSQYQVNPSKNIIALYGEDIGSGWTPNGLQLFNQNEALEELFTFNPRESLNELWGPTEIVWESDSTILIECIIHNTDSGYVTIYKKLEFEKE